MLPAELSLVGEGKKLARGRDYLIFPPRFCDFLGKFLNFNLLNSNLLVFDLRRRFGFAEIYPLLLGAIVSNGPS